ncbi:D-glutamate cyclase family protein, partial [Brooklawnia cerclae]
RQIAPRGRRIQTPTTPWIRMSRESALAADSDIATDLPSYEVRIDGRFVATRPDVTDLWRDDLVSVLIGCSYTIEWALADLGVPLRHWDQGLIQTGVYRSANPASRSYGRFGGPNVYTMRAFPPEWVDTVVATTALMPFAHGAPVHIGDPGELGIKLDDYLAPPTQRDGDVPVFWGCSGILSHVLDEVSIPLIINHSPGYMFVTDRRYSDGLPR